ncbi:hypothetical protein [Streptomyces sp. NPDC018833]
MQRVTERSADRFTDPVESAGFKTVLFVRNSGLLARYFDGAGTTCR